MKMEDKKKYTAHLVGFNTTAWGSTNREIQVDSEEEAKAWCNENSYMGGYDWYVETLVENKSNEL